MPAMLCSTTGDRASRQSVQSNTLPNNRIKDLVDVGLLLMWTVMQPPSVRRTIIGRFSPLQARNCKNC
jgi:hypothetical protein